MNTRTKKSKKNITRKCYNRGNNNLALVDTHLHLQPFDGRPIPFKKMVNILHNSGILYAEGEGIGQRIIDNNNCDYYLDCPSSEVRPSIKNDIINAENLKNATPEELHGIKINLSMTFPDLSKPETILKNVKFLNKKYPGMFGWMGEVNLVKQALFNNKHKPVPMNVIKKWRPFMRYLQKHHMPLSIHSDLGNNTEPLKYLPLMLEVLKLYPKNTIVWMHLGLSRELTNIDAKEHTELLDRLLRENPNLYFDISWSVLYEQKFKNEDERSYYVDLINKWPKRFLPGTDFVAEIHKDYKNYKSDLEKTSDILKYVNDEAFRRIALGQNYFDLLRLPLIAPDICGL
jgi:predicted TIM-barrel fold metal-dependent hydrolase